MCVCRAHSSIVPWRADKNDLLATDIVSHNVMALAQVARLMNTIKSQAAGDLSRSQCNIFAMILSGMHTDKQLLVCAIAIWCIGM